MATVKKIAKIIGIGLTLLVVAVYIIVKIFAINSVSELKRDSVPVEIVTIDAKTPENPYDYGDCIADWPWNVEVMNPDIDSNLSINKEKHIVFNYSSYTEEETLYDSMSEYDNYKAFFEQNNIYSDEDLTCYLYSYNSKDISMKYLFKPIKQLKKALFLCELQMVCYPEAVKVYDVRNGDLRAIVEVLKYDHDDISYSYLITIKSPLDKKNRGFRILDIENNLTEEDIFNFISTISFKEE